MSQSGDEEVNRREVAYRLFAAEFDDADFSYAESDEERAPNYVVTPTGARVNRLFVVGVLTEVEQVNDDVVRARVVDPTGAFVVYAGQYQPEALAALESADTPSFVAVTGKARTFQPDDADVVYTSIRPESVSEVDADTRDRWVVATAEQTVDRVATMAGAHGRVERGDNLRAVLEDAGVESGLAAGIPLALDHYETTPAYLTAVRDLALDAARVVSGDLDSAGDLELAPDQGGDASLGFATDFDVAERPAADETEPSTDETPEAAVADETEATTEASPEESADTDETPGSPEETAETQSPSDGAEQAQSEDGDSEPEAEAEVAAEAQVEAESEPEDGSVEESAEARADAADAAEASGDDGEMYELSEEERQEVEDNYDVGFSSGDEIPDAGEADLDAPEPEEAETDETESSDTAAEATEAVADGSDDDLGDFDDGDDGSFDSDDDPEDEDEEDDLDDFTEDEYDEPESDSEDSESPPPDLDLEDYVVDLMEELDDGDGAPRDEVVTTAADDLDADEGEIGEAIQSALMSGRCYESGDDHLKAI